MANGAVAAVKKGCALYKEIKGAAGQVKDVIDDLDRTFKAKHKDKPPSKEEIKQFNEERTRVKEVAQSDPNDVISQVGEQLGAFFDAFDKIEAVFWEEERAAKLVYTGDESLSKRALQRVLVRTRLENMTAEIREQMTWHSPPELKDLWGRFERMREQITQEQEIARVEQAKKDAIARWRRNIIKAAIWDNLLWLLALILVVIELVGMLAAIHWHQQSKLPSWLLWF